MNLENIRKACEEFRDTILHQRHQMAENGMENEQVNDVLSVYDDTIGAALAEHSAQPVPPPIDMELHDDRDRHWINEQMKCPYMAGPWIVEESWDEICKHNQIRVVYRDSNVEITIATWYMRGVAKSSAAYYMARAHAEILANTRAHSSQPVDTETCRRCRKQYFPMVWATDDETWEAVTGVSDCSGLFCPSCFAVMAQEKGVVLYWVATQGDWPASFVGIGRVPSTATPNRIEHPAAADSGHPESGPCDQKPPSTRESAVAIAADLVKQVEGRHRSLACEAARKLVRLNDENRRLREVYDEMLLDLDMSHDSNSEYLAKELRSAIKKATV